MGLSSRFYNKVRLNVKFKNVGATRHRQIGRSGKLKQRRNRSQKFDFSIFASIKNFFIEKTTCQIGWRNNFANYQTSFKFDNETDFIHNHCSGESKSGSGNMSIWISRFSRFYPFFIGRSYTIWGVCRIAVRMRYCHTMCLIL